MEIEIKDRFGNPVPEWYQGYVKALENRNFQEALSANLNSTIRLLNSISDEKGNYAYAPGKWTIKEVVLHFTDAERIFACRALQFARNDKTNLPGFDENEYAPYSNSAKRTMQSIIEEYAAVRRATIELFKNFDEEMLARTGSANGYTFSVDLSGIIIVGHELHHIKVIKERYL